MRRLRPVPLLLVLLLLPPLLAPAAAGDAGDVAATPGEVRVAVLDTGILASHPEFAPGQVVAWRDFVSGKPEPYDPDGHGTATASRAAGQTLGAHPGAKLLVGKVLGPGFGSWAVLASGIRWAADEGADVISVSIWSPNFNPLNNLLISDAVEHAAERGALVVWIAGNSGSSSVVAGPGLAELPATFLAGASSPKALVVGSAYPDGRRVPSSRMDPELLAPGCDVPVATRDNGSALACGTSFAAPWVAGVAARMLFEGAPRDPSWLQWVLTHVAKDEPLVGQSHEGYGFLGPAQAERAYAIARGDEPVPGWDARDAVHLVTETARVVTSPGKTPEDERALP